MTTPLVTIIVQVPSPAEFLTVAVLDIPATSETAAASFPTSTLPEVKVVRPVPPLPTATVPETFAAVPAEVIYPLSLVQFEILGEVKSATARPLMVVPLWV